MPRLRNSKTGAVVSTSDEITARLGGEWESAEKKSTTSKAPAKKAASSKSEK